ICTYLATLLAALLVGVCLRQLAHRVKFRASRRPELFRGLIFGNHRLVFLKLPALAIYTLFVGQFLWLTELFLTNNIKTNKVVTIRTVHLISSGSISSCKSSKISSFLNHINRLFQVVDTSQLIKDDFDMLRT